MLANSTFANLSLRLGLGLAKSHGLDAGQPPILMCNRHPHGQLPKAA
jgi:hypothetical protein